MSLPRNSLIELNTYSGMVPAPNRPLVSEMPPANAIAESGRSRSPVRSVRLPGTTGNNQLGSSRHTILAGDDLQEDGSRATHAPQARPKRSLFFMGVEILHYSDRFNDEYLECGTCRHTLRIVPKYKYVKGDLSPKSQMEYHITETHKEQPPARRTYECCQCSEEFLTRMSLKDHKREHSSLFETTCEICARTMNCSRNQAPFRRHQFTHKNDEQRAAAYDAKEVGSFNFFLDPSNRRRRVRGSRSAMARAGKSHQPIEF